MTLRLRVAVCIHNTEDNRHATVFRPPTGRTDPECSKRFDKDVKSIKIIFRTHCHFWFLPVLTVRNRRNHQNLHSFPTMIQDYWDHTMVLFSVGYMSLYRFVSRRIRPVNHCASLYSPCLIHRTSFVRARHSYELRISECAKYYKLMNSIIIIMYKVQSTFVIAEIHQNHISIHLNVCLPSAGLIEYGTRAK